MPIQVELYYADWCGHCHSFMSEWAKLNTQIGHVGGTCQKINAKDIDPDTKRKKGIDGYPTILVIANGKSVEYKGSRTAEGIIEFIKTNLDNNKEEHPKQFKQCAGGREADINYKLKYYKYKAKYMKLVGK